MDRKAVIIYLASLGVIRHKGVYKIVHLLYYVCMTYKTGSWGEKAQARSKARKEYFKEYARKGRKPFTPKGCHKINARQKVRDYVLAGKIVKPLKCSNCNQVTRLEAHHEDYLKPLEVIFLCKGCHVVADALRFGKTNK